MKLKTHPGAVPWFLFLLVFLGARTDLAAQENEWPRDIIAPKATITIYQPQPETFKDNHLTARSAVSVTMKDNPEPVFGAAWYDATVATNRDDRTVEVKEVKVTKVKFPDATPEQEQKFIDVVSREMTGWKLKGSLDRLMTTLELAEKEEKAATALNNKPPKILFFEQPAVLVRIDGNPVLKPAEGSSIQRIINSPFQIFFDPAGKTYYLWGTPHWYSASDLKGDWQVSEQVPEDVKKLADTTQAGAGGDQGIPKIVVATEPTELIVSQGVPQWVPVVGNELSYLKNSDEAVFLHHPTQTYYVTFSGRWFSTKATVASGTGLWNSITGPLQPPKDVPASQALQGPWSYVSPDKLPKSFSQLPKDFPNEGILASVPGTEEAQDAVMDAQIPQTTVIDKKTAKFNPTYDGTPKFEDISGTELDYAVNTPDQIIKSGGKYYAVDQGVWYVADNPDGPYQVSDQRPEGVDAIPPDNPNYNTKYVYVYDSDDDSATVGYTAGYLGSFVVGTALGAALTWGSGYNYYPWSGNYYYPRPYTYGYNAYYNSYTGGWGYRGPYGGAWYRGDAWAGNGYWGAGGYRDIDIDNLNINRNNINIDRDNFKNNLYDRKQNLGRNVDKNRLSQIDKNRMDKLGERGPSAGRDRSKVAAHRPNDVFADKDGNVFKRDKEGKWQQREGKDWRDADRPGELGDKRPSRDLAMKEDRPHRERPEGLDRPQRDRPEKLDRPHRERPEKLDRQAAHERPVAHDRPARREGSFDRKNMDRQSHARQRGDTRAKDYSNYHASRGGGRERSASFHGGGGGRRDGGGGGGRRGGGGGRRR